jgi:hypothetical protein
MQLVNLNAYPSLLPNQTLFLEPLWPVTKHT